MEEGEEGRREKGGKDRWKLNKQFEGEEEGGKREYEDMLRRRDSRNEVKDSRRNQTGYINMIWP